MAQRKHFERPLTFTVQKTYAIMHVHRRRLLVLVCVVGFGFALGGCDQSGGMDEELSPDEAEERIGSAIDGLRESAGTLEEGAFSSSLKDFFGLSNGEATSESWAATLIGGLDSVIESTDERFQFDASTGEYAWDAGTKQWAENGSSDSIILEFPATQGATINNATFELSQYSDTPLAIDGETVYLPTSGVASLRVDDEEVFAVDLEGVDYTTEEGLDIPIPQSFALEIVTAPHTHTFTLNENSGTEYDFSFDLANGEQRVAGISVGAQLATDNYDELQGTDVEELSGELRIGPDLTIPYTVQVGELAAFGDPTEDQINDRIDATVQSQGQEIATLRFDKASERIEVVYSDGSIDPASTFYRDFLDEVEAIWSDYLGDEALETGFDALSVE